MTVQQTAAFFAGGIAVMLLYCFLDDIFALVKHFAKFLIYDVYAGLFPKQIYKIAALPLKSFKGVTEAYLFLKVRLYFQCFRDYWGEVSQCAGDALIRDKESFEKHRLDLLAGVFEDYLHGSPAKPFWIQITETALGYCSQNLLMRLKPFREEILKELFFASMPFSEEDKEFLNQYAGQHGAAAD